MLFLFSTDDCIRVEMQRRPPGVVYWDYHVVATARRDASSPWLVFDPDSMVPLGSRTLLYLDASFPGPDATRRFRLFSMERARAEFGSDRSHMRGDDGRWLAPPPPWRPINPAVGNLMRLVRPDPDDAPFGAAPSIDLSELCFILKSSYAVSFPDDA